MPADQAFLKYLSGRLHPIAGRIHCPDTEGGLAAAAIKQDLLAVIAEIDQASQQQPPQPPLPAG